jgi:hypothetical protein
MSSAGRSTSETLLRPVVWLQVDLPGRSQAVRVARNLGTCWGGKRACREKNQWFSELSGQWGRQLNRLTLVLDHLSIIHIGVVRTSIGAGQRSQQVAHRRLHRSMVDCPFYDHRTDSIFYSADYYTAASQAFARWISHAVSSASISDISV